MPDDKKKAVVEPLRSNDPEDEEMKKLTKQVKKGKGKEEEENELTPEELKLKEDLELYVERAMDKNADIGHNALVGLQKEIRSATSSMTSVPLPLKFLGPHFAPLKKFYEGMLDGHKNKTFLADILSVLAMTMGKPGGRESLKFKLQGSIKDLGSWGHEFVRNLAGEIGTEYQHRIDEKQNVDELLVLVNDIIPFKIKHNAEFEAIDLLIEVEKLDKLPEFISADNTKRVCNYLITCSDYIGDPDEKKKMLMIAYNAYLKNTNYADAIRLAVKLDNRQLIIDTINSTDDELMQKQMAFILSTSKIILEEFEDEDELMEVMGSVYLNENFLKLAEELSVVEPKVPEDIYKTNLSTNTTARRPPARSAGVDSARQNLASTFVNAFVNCGFGNDKLISPQGSEWLFKNKSHGMMSAAASLGMIVLWDVESGFCSVDKYTLSTQSFIQAGALLATGILSSGITSDMDAAFALLSEEVESEDKQKKIAAVYGLGLAYAGSAKEDVMEILVPLLVSDQSLEVVALTCLSLGLVYVGTANDDLASSMLEAFRDCSKTDLNDSLARLMGLGMGLLFLGQGEMAESTLKEIKVIEHPIQKYLAVTVETCAEVGSNSVLAIQKFIQMCGEHIKEDDLEPSTDEKKGESKENSAIEEKKMDALVQEVAVLGVAMVAMGDPLSVDMALRALDHILQYGEVNIRRAIPLSLALISVSNPRLHVMDTLSKLTHDQDEQVSQNAILSLGFLGAGTNNSRIANILRSLADYYAKEPNHLFLVRIAQGLLHLGKGLMTLNPFHSDNLLLSKVSMCGLLTIMHSSFDMKNNILGNRHYLLFSLVTSIRPRMLITLNEDLEPIPVRVQVGQALETVALAGIPKTITAFQTHTTPVLLAAGERAELATDKYIPLTNVLEGFVILRPNPEATITEEEEKKDTKK